MMPIRGRISGRLLACFSAVVLVGLASSSSASAQVFYPTDRYDCTAYQAATGGVVYVDSYQFESGHRYAVGFRKLSSKTGLSKEFGHGTYKLSGSKIISTSGYLTSRHEYLLIQTNDLALVKNGRFQSIGCYDATKHKLPSGGSGSFLGGKSSVTYSCYETEYFSGVYSLYRDDVPLTFYSDGTYQWTSIRESGWHQNADTIGFTAGSFWGSYAHDQGTWYPSGGKVMPHAPASVAGLTYSLVIRDTKAEGGLPPMTEFATSGPDSVTPASFLYCKK